MLLWGVSAVTLPAIRAVTRLYVSCSIATRSAGATSSLDVSSSLIHHGQCFAFAGTFICLTPDLIIAQSDSMPWR